MKLNISYDSTTLADAPSAFFSAVNYVVNLFDSTFTNNSTVNIEVGYGDFPFDGSTVAPLGISEQNNVVFGDYSQVSQILAAEGAPGAKTLPSNSPMSGQLTLGSAQEKALGLLGANTSLDGWVGIASDAALQQLDGGSWSYSPTVTPSSNAFYIVGVIEHEFAEVMGRTSYLTDQSEYGVMDLYRYAASGVRQTGTGDPAYFSIDGGNTNLGNWNDPSISSGDLGDWAPDTGALLNFRYAGADAFLSESPPGQINGLSATDLTLMAALGWNATPPRPGKQYVFSALNQTVNLVSTNDGTNLPAAIAGQFNIELVTQPFGTSYPLPSGYQAVAILPGGTGRALQVLTGDMAIADTGSGDTITLGQGAQTVTGATGDTITGGSGSDLINVTLGPEQITGGSGNATVLAGSGDMITGGSGPMTIVGGASSTMTITGGAGGLMAFDFGTNNSVTGGGQQTFIDDSYGSGGNNTLVGGSGGTSFLVGAAGDLLKGGTGSLTTLNAVLGSQTVIGGSGFGTDIQGGANDLLVGGSGNLILVAAGSASTVFGGSNTLAGAGTDVFTLGAGDSIVGQAGSLTVGGNAVTNVTISGGTGNLTAFNLGTHYSVDGASTGTTVINDAYGAGGSDTLIGGGSATTIIAGANDSIVGRAGALEVRIRSNIAGVETVNLSAAAAGIRDVSVTGGTGAAASVTGFNTTTDKIESATSSGTYLVAHAGTDGSGNVVLNFLDGSTMTLANVTNVNAITFTS